MRFCLIFCLGLHSFHKSVSSCHFCKRKKSTAGTQTNSIPSCQAEKLLALEDTKVLTEQRYEKLKQRQHQVLLGKFGERCGDLLGGLCGELVTDNMFSFCTCVFLFVCGCYTVTHL